MFSTDAAAVFLCETSAVRSAWNRGKWNRPPRSAGFEIPRHNAIRTEFNSVVRLSFLPYKLTREDAARLCAVLARQFDGTRTLRDLERRHRIWPHIAKAAAEAGFVRIEKRQPRTGRPSYVAVLEPDGVNKSQAAKLPSRHELPKPLSFREETFLQYYACRRGISRFGGGSAADAYWRVYGCHRTITRASARSAGARLMRRPWMKAAFYLDRRMTANGGRLHWPRDLYSAAWQWLNLVRAFNQFGDWPADICFIVRHANTYPEAVEGLRRLKRFRDPQSRADFALALQCEREPLERPGATPRVSQGVPT
jgi:hypothetical protein